jgi:DNA-damage-inducible protein J
MAGTLHAVVRGAAKKNKLGKGLVSPAEKGGNKAEGGRLAASRIVKQPSLKSKMLHIRIDESLRQEAEQTLKVIGMSISDAMRLFLHRVVIEQRLPLTLDVPNADTIAAIEEARSGHLKKHRTAEDLFDAIETRGK